MKRLIAYGLMAAVLGLAGTANALVAVGGGGRGPAPRPPGLAPVGWAYRYVNPVYQTLTEHLWVPDRTEMVQTWVQISPGRLEQVWQQVVIPGHWQSSTRRLLVADGHWELVRIDPPPIVIPSPPIVVVPGPVRNPGTTGVEIYGNSTIEDLSKFSGLREWPDKK